jgi:uncharacterized protein YndB with AHSA1/START domain
MEKMQFSIVINASKKKVWKTMLDKGTYEEWTDVFMPGSTYDGDWTEGSKILFLAPDESGKMSGGMVSRVKENRPYEFISLETVGVVYNGEEDTTSKEAREWAGSLENYTFKELDGKTEVQVDLSSDMDVDQEMLEMSERIWPKALNKLKELAEKS